MSYVDKDLLELYTVHFPTFDRDESDDHSDLIVIIFSSLEFFSTIL